MPNVAYEYRYINHVAEVPGDYDTVEEFHAAVQDKYRRLERQRAGAAPAPAEPEKPRAPEPEPETQPEPEAQYKVVKADGIGWYDVVGADGKPITEKSMRRDEANKLAARKNAGD